MQTTKTMSYSDKVCTLNVNGMPCTNIAKSYGDGYARCNNHKHVLFHEENIDIDQIEDFAKKAGWVRTVFKKCHYCHQYSDPTFCKDGINQTWSDRPNVLHHVIMCKFCRKKEIKL